MVLLGPTGVGKTDLSYKIYDENIEIISVDSVQVYRYFDIGSSKPDSEIRKKIIHHLIDIVDPDYNFTAGDFCRYANIACSNIYKKKKYPLFIGGTPFYIDSFFNGLSEIPEIDEAVKIQLKSELIEYGLHFLFEELKKCDEVFSRRIHLNDKQRILRGLEVFRGTGKPLSGYFINKVGHESKDTLYIGLLMDREILKKRIDQRVDCMIQSGLIDEVNSLRKMGYNSDLKSMQSIGYLEINKYLDNELSLTDAVDKIKSETRKYAKRQMTWFRRNKKIQWIEPADIKKIKEIINKIFFN
ncbi:MAG: tRNA (adenosine(37)-N6)-dimethylallyltransferase MiaA [Spirochaetota bacterium]